jgi:hypothetical protein
MKVQPGDTLVALAVLGPAEEAAPNGDIADERVAAEEPETTIVSSDNALARVNGASGESPLPVGES